MHGRTEAEAQEVRAAIAARLHACQLELPPEKTKIVYKRRTARKKLRSALKRFTAWCKEHRHLRLPVLFQRLNAKLRGYYHYYGVHGNAASLKEFFNSAMRILLKWLNRRSQRHRYTWQGYNEVLERLKVARPRIVGRPKTRQAALKA